MENLNPLDIIIHIVNLLVLFVILRTLLYKPVHKFLAARRQKIDDQLQNAQDVNAKAEANLAKAQEKIDSAEQDAKEVVSKVIADANEKASQIIDDATVKAQGVVESAKQKAKQDSDKAFEEQQDAIIDMSVSIASKVLSREVTAEDNHAIVESFFSKVGKEND